MTTPTSYAYQWLSGGSNATGPGATTSSYTVVTADEGAVLSCQVTGTNAAGSEQVTSAATSTVQPPATAPNVPANRMQGFVSPALEAGTAGTVAAWESTYGRHADFLQTYLEWATGTSAVQTLSGGQVSDGGTRPWLLTVQPCGNPANTSQTSVVNWQNLIAGDYDTEIQAFASWINSTLGRTTYVRFAHEMNISPASWYPWQVGGHNGVTSPSNYAAGFNHFSSVLKAASSFVKTVWCPNNNGSDPVPWYSSGCDIMGLDGYNNQANGWQTDTAVYETSYNYVASCDPSKPIWVCETGSTEGTGGNSKATWVTTMLNNSAFPRMQAVCWFDKNYNSNTDPTAGGSGANFAMNSSSGATTAYYNGFENSRLGAVFP